MPELPEVETTLQGIKPYIEQQIVQKVIIRHHQLRWPIPHNIDKLLSKHKLRKATRRAKYLLLEFDHGTAIIHLGMSGSLRLLTKPNPPQKHQHFDIEFANHIILRFTDPRRFGALLWTEKPIQQHVLFRHLGVEPLAKAFNGNYLWQLAQGRKIAIKTFIMDQKIVVGVGNIYANEALFNAGIHPLTPAANISLLNYNLLAKSIKAVLRHAIKQGGTTLRNFISSDGRPGYFSQHLKVYGRDGLTCYHCQTSLTSTRIGQRSTVYCDKCQIKY